MKACFRRGQPVIYCVQKYTSRPGPRAKRVHSEEKGEYYNYVVEKFWAVAEVYDDGSLLLITRRGKTHRVRIDDEHLRLPRIWERVVYRHRFPTLEMERDASACGRCE